MQLLNKDDLTGMIGDAGPGRLHIDPLLEPSQLGEVTVDLRLGYDFLVSILTRKAYVGLAPDEAVRRGIASYFQVTRREMGEKFILYPNQVVLATSLEYVALPGDVYIDVLTRSSYARLGIAHNTMIQPGFRGCIPVELYNHGNNAVELVVGSRVFQARFFRLSADSKYQAQTLPRKYYGNVRPTPSQAAADPDLAVLRRMIR